MDFRNEIQGILHSKGIDSAEADKTIFGIAVIGLIIGNDKLNKTVQNNYLVENFDDFKENVLSFVSKEEVDKADILKESLNLIHVKISGKELARITEIIFEQDLLEIVLHMRVSEYDSAFSLSSVESVNQLVVEILRLHKGETLYNVDCGKGEFIMDMCDAGIVKSAVGHTYNATTYSIAKIRAYFSSENINIERKSFFSSALNEKVDMVYNSYPLIFKYDKKDEVMPMIDSWNFSFKFEKKYSSNLLWIINALQSIKQDGIVVAFIPNGVLYNSIDMDIRRYLIENNCIDTIISLPLGMLPFTSVATSIMILKRNRRNHQYVRMVNAVDVCSVHRRYKYFKQEDIAYIIDLYTGKESTDKSFDISLKEIMMNDCYLGFNRYCGQSLINPCMLSIVTKNIFRGYQIKANELDEISIASDIDSDYRIINISDIQTEGFVSANLKPIRVEDTKKYNKYCVEDGDIIITAKNTAIKTAIYRSRASYRAILTGNLIAIRVNKDKMDPYYFKAFLDSEQGQRALKSIQTGTSIITLNVNSLKSMQVSLLSLDQQKKIADEYFKSLKLLEELHKRCHTTAAHLRKIYEDALNDRI